MNSSITTLGLLTLSLLCACGSQKDAAEKPNVILVCLDTVRADHLGCYGYEALETTPFLDSLASKSLQFTNASATACWTKPSVPSIFTGMLPMQHGVYRGSAQDVAGSYTDVLPQQALTLAEVFQRQGYQTAAFVKNAQLRQGLGFEQGFDLYRDRAGDAREIRWLASDWIDQRDKQRPFFLYLHLLDAHWPYTAPTEYSSKWADPEQVTRIQSGDWREFRDAINRGERTISEEEKSALIALYDSSIRYMDDQLALLWSKLARAGEDQNTIICVISDHGEEFLEHGKLGHGHGLHENLLAVPWILYRPGHQPKKNTNKVSLLDLYPTLLAAAGILNPSPHLPGVNRLALPKLQRPILAEHLDPNRYHLSWTEAGQKTVDIVRLETEANASQRSISELRLRGRWEARFTALRPGELLVTRLQPAKEDESAQVDTELKGPIADWSPQGFTIAGIEVSINTAPEYYGTLQIAEDGQQTPFEGQMAKVSGQLLEGRLVARKIKLYAADTRLETELRGTIAIQSESQISIGSLQLAINQDTAVKFRKLNNDLGAQQVVQLLMGDLSWQERSSSGIQLESDAEEMHPQVLDQGPLTNPDQIELIRSFLSARVWQGGQEILLSEEAIDDLNLIGY